MGKDPETIEREIDDTRTRIGDRMDALSHKADLPGQIGDRLAETRDSVRGKLSGLASNASDRAPSQRDLRLGAQRAAGWIRANPLPMAAGALATGVLVGLLLPSTRAEDDRLGEAADEVRRRALDTGREALDRGGRQAAQVAAEAAGQAGASAKEQARPR